MWDSSRHRLHTYLKAREKDQPLEGPAWRTRHNQASLTTKERNLLRKWKGSDQVRVFYKEDPFGAVEQGEGFREELCQSK